MISNTISASVMDNKGYFNNDTTIAVFRVWLHDAIY